jgi:hypothetical protein
MSQRNNFCQLEVALVAPPSPLSLDFYSINFSISLFCNEATTLFYPFSVAEQGESEIFSYLDLSALR